MKSVVVISGPTSGLGRSLLHEVLCKGVTTIAVGRRLERLAGASLAESEKLIQVECDLAGLLLHGAVERLDASLAQAVNQPNVDQIVLLNNAGVINPIGLVGDVDSVACSASLGVNLLAPMVLTNACVSSAKRLGARLLVLNISSGASLRPIPGWSAYCATKAAARMYFEVLAAESPEMVTVEQIDPGVLDTAMQETIRDSSPSQFPLVGKFAELKTEGSLKSPALVAKKIVERYLAGIER
jgi:NAD(P)-dependent dehydrogenase (short-subunit alcohol dehydrogenase family)